MRARSWRRRCVLSAAVMLACASRVWAAVTPAGNVAPADPTTWTLSTSAYVGNAADGHVTVDGGSALLSASCNLGQQAGTSGMIQVTGAGSSWQMGPSTSFVYVGFFGNGTLQITSGGSVTGAYVSEIGWDAASRSAALVDGVGSLWLPGSLVVEDQGVGSLTISNGAQVISGTTQGDSYVGYSRKGMGTVVITGTGSLRQLGGQLIVGQTGQGVITMNGGQLAVGTDTKFAMEAGASGMISFGASGGTLTTGSVFGLPTQFQGGGVVNTRGLVSDGILTFDSAASLTQTLMWGATHAVTVNLDLSGISGPQGDLGAGYSGAGSLTITNGVPVTSAGGWLAELPGSGGTAVVSGTGSKWILVGGFNDMFVGVNGNASLSLLNGATGSGRTLYVANGSASTATMTVDAANWTGSGAMYVGYGGQGTLVISHQGTVDVAGLTWLGVQKGSSGTLQFGAGGGTLDTESFIGGPAQVTGTGTINTHGLVSDGDLVVDATHPLPRTLLWHGTGQNVTVNLTASGVPGALGAGYSSVGCLTVKEGAKVSASVGYLGMLTGSAGTALISGTGSSFTSSVLYVGYGGSGALTVEKGAQVSASGNCFLGQSSGASGTLTVDGSGSTFTASQVFVGYAGVGAICVLHGGKIQANAQVGYALGGGNGPPTPSVGVVTISGSGSTWTGAFMVVGGSGGNGMVRVTNLGLLNCTQALSLAPSGPDTANVLVDGGQVSAGAVLLSQTSQLELANGGLLAARFVNTVQPTLISLMVGDGSAIDVSTGTLSNNGTLRLKAAPGAVAGSSYAPITAAAWSGTGSVVALGGSWNASTHAFTVSPATAGNAGKAVAIDRMAVQRIAITDPTMGKSVIAEFSATPGSSMLSLTGAMTTPGAPAVPVMGEIVLAQWFFATDGYTPGDPVALSLEVGPGLSADHLSIWHFNGTSWSPYVAPDLSYDGAYANFTVSSFSGYAVTETVPEAQTLALLLAGAAVLGLRRR